MSISLRMQWRKSKENHNMLNLYLAIDTKLPTYSNYRFSCNHTSSRHPRHILLLEGSRIWGRHASDHGVHQNEYRAPTSRPRRLHWGLAWLWQYPQQIAQHGKSHAACQNRIALTHHWIGSHLALVIVDIDLEVIIWRHTKRHSKSCGNEKRDDNGKLHIWDISRIESLRIPRSDVWYKPKQNIQLFSNTVAYK